MITTVTYHGPSRKNIVTDLLKYDVVLTTYETLREDSAALKNPEVYTIYSHYWHRIVLDEGAVSPNFRHEYSIHILNRS